VDTRTVSVDHGRVSASLLLFFCVLAAVLMDSVMVHAGVAPPVCGRCGRPRERRLVDEGICRCS
jgi:hypothetical protein